jgi:hypothetical protein
MVQIQSLVLVITTRNAAVSKKRFFLYCVRCSAREVLHLAAVFKFLYYTPYLTSRNLMRVWRYIEQFPRVLNAHNLLTASYFVAYLVCWMFLWDSSIREKPSLSLSCCLLSPTFSSSFPSVFSFTLLSCYESEAISLEILADIFPVPPPPPPPPPQPLEYKSYFVKGSDDGVYVCMCKGWAIKPAPAPRPSMIYCATSTA